MQNVLEGHLSRIQYGSMMQTVPVILLGNLLLSTPNELANEVADGGGCSHSVFEVAALLR